MRPLPSAVSATAKVSSACFPLHSPRVDKIEVERKGEVRRAKLTYLRKRLGKGATLVREKEEKAVPNRPPSKRNFNFKAGLRPRLFCVFCRQAHLFEPRAAAATASWFFTNCPKTVGS